MKKATLLLIALSFISCSSFGKKAFHKRIIATYDFLIASDSLINDCKKCDSLRVEKDKKLNRYDYIRNF